MCWGHWTSSWIQPTSLMSIFCVPMSLRDVGPTSIACKAYAHVVNDKFFHIAQHLLLNANGLLTTEDMIFLGFIYCNCHQTPALSAFRMPNFISKTNSLTSSKHILSHYTYIVPYCLHFPSFNIPYQVIGNKGFHEHLHNDKSTLR